MKPRPSHQRTVAMTLTEVVVVVAVIILLVVILLLGLIDTREKAQRIGCVSNLGKIGSAYKYYDIRFPMQNSVTNGVAMELVATGGLSAVFCVMSNELDMPVVLVCPADKQRTVATSFATLGDSNISYFINLDAVDTQPQTLLSGDDNLMVNGTNVPSGILNLHANDVLAWTKERHQGSGNILLGDGSVQQATSDDLTSAARLATNRLAIP